MTHRKRQEPRQCSECPTMVQYLRKGLCDRCYSWHRRVPKSGRRGKRHGPTARATTAVDVIDTAAPISAVAERRQPLPIPAAPREVVPKTELAMHSGERRLGLAWSRNALNRLLAVVHDEDKNEDWRDDAICATTDPELFFPEKGGTTKPAKQVCRSVCPVRAQCLQYALDNDERFGIWGGYSERERRRMKESRGRGAKTAMTAVRLELTREAVRREAR